MRIQYIASIFLAVTQVSASAIDLNARDNAIVARDPQCHRVKRDDTPEAKKHKTTTTCKTTTRKTTAKHTKSTTAKTTKKTTTPKHTTKATKTTTKPTRTTTSAGCVTESGQCDPTGTAFPPCCQGQCIQGFNAFFCRTNCLPDGSPCTLDRPDVCCGQICLVDGYCVTI